MSQRRSRGEVPAFLLLGMLRYQPLSSASAWSQSSSSCPSAPPRATYSSYERAAIASCDACGMFFAFVAFFIGAEVLSDLAVFRATAFMLGMLNPGSGTRQKSSL